MSPPSPTGHRFAERTRAKHATIPAFLKAGHSRRSVARQLGMTLNTILRFSQATTLEELFTGQWQSRATRLDATSLTSTSAGGGLYQRLEAVGGDQRAGLPGRLWQRPQVREQDSAPRTPAGRAPAAIAPRRDPLAPDPPRTRWSGATGSSSRLCWRTAPSCTCSPSMCGPLPTWSPTCTATNCQSGSNQPEPLPTCQPWNSGVVEGHVNRIMMLKRQMFDRAGFELLRKRVLLAK